MTAATRGRYGWTVAAPVVAVVLLAATWGRHPPVVVSSLVAVC